MISFFFRFLFKLFFLCLLIAAGASAYIYVQYKSLIDVAFFPKAADVGIKQVGTPADGYSFKKTEIPARDFPPLITNADIEEARSLAAEAAPENKEYEGRIAKEIAEARAVPLTGLLGYAQNKVQYARRRLNEAAVKLARANPQDPVKAAKVAKARRLLPRAQRLLDRADTVLAQLSSMQDKGTAYLKSLRSKF